MLYLADSNRDNPGVFTCQCGNEVHFVIHNDYMEGYCMNCGTEYAVKLGTDLYNCCSAPENGCGNDCEKKLNFYNRLNDSYERYGL